MNEEELKLAIKSAFNDAGFRAANAEIKRAEGGLGGLGKVAGVAGRAIAAGIAVGGVALGAFAVKAVMMASDIGESQSKVNVVFGESAAVINDLAATAATALGQTKGEVLAAAGTVGNLLTAMGMTQEAAAGMSVDMVKLATDLGSFNNADPTEVLEALRSGLTGEAEPMKKFGVALNEVAMKAAAMKAGLGDNVQALSEAQKMQLRYNIIMEQTKTAQGDFDRTSTGLANTMKIIKSSFSDVVGEIGQKLLPTVQAAASAFATGFADAKKNGLDVFDAALAAVTKTLESLGIEDAEAKVKAFGDMVVNVAAFVRDDLWPALVNVGGAVVNLGKFLADNRGIVLTVVGAYAALKTAMAINKAVESASAAISAAKAAWIAYRAGTQGATLATTSFGTALKLALGPIGWIAIAVGALYVAWKTNFGGIQEKTAAVVNWIKGVPAMVEAAWGQVKLGLALLVNDFKAKFAAIPEGVRTAAKVLLMILFPLPMLFTKTGRDMVAGLWNGLKAGWDAMVGWVTGKAKALIASVKGVFKMSSPSRVMIEIGRGIMDGWALGMVAGGVWVVRTARQVMDDTLAEFHAADAAAVAGGVVAAMAKAAVDAALAADGVIKGARESAADAWGRYYDELMRREDELHEQKMADLDTLAKEENRVHEKAKSDAIELIELQKRRIEGLLQQQREAEQKNGGSAGGAPPGLKGFDDELERIEARLRPLLEMLGFNDDDALEDWWDGFHDGGQRAIETAEELADALGALAGEVGNEYDRLGELLEAAQSNRMLSEEARHKEVMRLLNERKAFIDALIQAQADAEADLADLIAVRDKLLAEARERIAAAQKAAETAEDRIHAGVMKNIEAERKAEERAHKGRLIHFEEERKAIDAAHERRMAQLQAQRDKITAGFDERQRQIEKDKTALSQLKLDLGVEDALVRLTGLEQKLNDLQAIMDSFKIVSRGREALDEQRRAITERVKITTDAQRKALQDVLDSGTLNARDQRRVELLLLGRGTQKAEDVRRILGAGADVLKGEIAAAQMIVDYNTQQVAIRERLIEQAETQLRIDQESAQVQIDALDKRIAAEDERYKQESANLAARMTAEQQAFDDTMAWYDAISDAEDERHAKRMADIAAEYALELAKLGMTQSEIDAMVAAARTESERIARETEAAWKRIRDAMGLPGIGAVGGGTSTPTQPIPIIGGGGEIRGLRPQGGGAVEGVTITGEVSAKDATIQNVEFGGLTMNTALTFRIGAKDIAAEIVDAVIGDTALVDKLGARINARTGPRIGGSTP